MKRRSATSSDRDQSTMNRTKARFKLTILSGEDGLEDGNCKSMQSAHVTRRVCFKRAQAYLSEKHLSEDASDRPDVDRMVVLLPREHDLGRSVVPRGNVTRHLGVWDIATGGKGQRELTAENGPGKQERKHGWEAYPEFERDRNRKSKRHGKEEEQRQLDRLDFFERPGGLRSHLEVAVLVDENVGRLEISVDDPG